MSIFGVTRRGSVWKRVLLVAALVPVVGAGSIVPAYAAPSDPVVFADANLESCVRAKLQVDSPAPVTEADLTTLTSLHCGGWGFAPPPSGVIYDISPLRYATNLKSLHLQRDTFWYSSEYVGDTGPVLDVSPLEGLAHLKSLILAGQNVSDVSPLAGLTNLETLSLYGGRLTDVSPLVGLTIATVPPDGVIWDLGGAGGVAKPPGEYLWFKNQRVDDVAATGIPVPSPVRHLDGTQLALKPLDASGTVSGAGITWSTPGIHKASWEAKIYEHIFSGIVTYTVTDPTVGVEGLPPAGQVGSYYQHNFTLTGNPGMPRVNSSDLPPGLSLSAEGVLSGKPTQAGTFTFVVNATNSGLSQDFSFTVTIAPITPEPTPTPEPSKPSKPTPGTLKVSPFTDVPVGHQYYREIAWMKESKLSTGFADGSYRPNDGVSREAMAAFIYRLEAPKNYRAPKNSPFTDVPTSHKFYREIAWMKESKLSTGFADGSYRPKDGVSREAMAAFIYRLESKTSKKFIAPKKAVFADVQVGQKFAKEIAWMKESKLSTGFADGSYRPKDGVSREAMAAFIYRLRASATS